ncbi:MAG: ribbon-helix-helix domain-containing protein [Actinomycetota bacterium]|nr:ribbon-helix-helix domain-containing protein [Actinomycetota bacterium]MDQ3732486.1 ribbon-helix-helix domain-containing protein [Actinomycetota bacterium]
MTERMTLVQARVSEDDAHRLDSDARALGLANRSEGIREALRLLHAQARHLVLAEDYDTFYGAGVPVPVSEVAAIGDRIAAEVLSYEPIGT